MISVRSASIGDAFAILEIHQDSIRRVASRDYSEQQVSGWSDHLQAEGYVKAMMAGAHIFVAEQQGQVVGFSWLLKNQVHAIYVGADFIGQGVGRKLYAAVEEKALAVGEQKLLLSSSISAEAFYYRLGFRKIANDVLRLSSGVELACIHMEKNLVV